MENWKPIPGYEGAYEVSDLGNVRSLNRITDRGRKWRGKAMTPTPLENGYLIVTLWRGGKQRTRLVHRLVLMAFVGQPDVGLEALHSDGDRTHNALSNLSWGTHAERTSATSFATAPMPTPPRTSAPRVTTTTRRTPTTTPAASSAAAAPAAANTRAPTRSERPHDMDISDTLAPKSDQLDAVDLLGAPQTFTVTNVSKGNAEQPVNVHLAEFPRVWRPGKSMRRVLAYCWGTDAKAWEGRRVTLYCDESVTFGNDVTGGTRISHLSHIDGRKKIPLPVKRGKSATFTVDPLPDLSPVDALKAEWRTATPERRAAIEAEVAKLNGASA